jgi:hypothetical protein
MMKLIVYKEYLFVQLLLPCPYLMFQGKNNFSRVASKVSAVLKKLKRVQDYLMLIVLHAQTLSLVRAR